MKRKFRCNLIRQNILRWFGQIERKNNEDIVKKIGEVRIKSKEKYKDM